MSEQPPTTVDDSDATDARFSLRAVLKIMAVVAVVAAVLGPVVRQLDAAQQRRLLTAWGLWLAGAVVWIGLQARRRFEAERLAGPTIIRLPMFDERVPGMTIGRRNLNRLGAFLLVLLGLFVLSFAALDVGNARTLQSLFLMSAFYAVFSIGFFSRAVFSFWWRTSIRFCESGILWDRTLLFWTHVISHQWTDAGGTLELRGSDANGGDAKIQVAVPWTRREAIEQLLGGKATDRPSVAAVDAGTGAGMPGRPASQRTLRKAVRIAASMVLGLAVFYFFASGPHGTAEFQDMLFVGILAGAVVQTIKGTMISKRAGPPLVRLYGRVGLLPSLALFAVCVACYVVGTSYAWTRPWLAYLTGLGCGMTLILSSLPGVFTHLELRDGGVFYPGRSLWPWSSVRLIRWDAGGTGRLVLGRGWRRIVARVPAEQRSAVDEVLAQKLGLPVDARASEASA